jgi:hypothetical protein
MQFLAAQKIPFWRGAIRGNRIFIGWKTIQTF